jgi:RecJ-like exonuclease
VAPAPGGVKIAEVWAKRAALSGKPVVLRGQVVKVNYAIMGTNWYHLQDGSGVVADGTHDLVVTSSAEVKAGDVVTVSGVLTTDKDFGAGYAYDAIIEKADIRK